MGLKKLTAGDGYTYLTRQVAAHDATEKGHGSLGEYYDAKGESPGQWLGSGLTGLGMEPGATVTAEQMKELFGLGRHPDAGSLQAAVAARGGSKSQVEAAATLGRRFPVFLAASSFNVQVARAFTAFNIDRGTKWNAVIPLAERARIRTDIGTAMFTERHGRTPTDSRELAGSISRASRQATSAVAGYDLTFSPVKSISTLWALAPVEVAEQIRAAHDAAVADTIGWIEREVAFTRVGRAGARQVRVRGLIAAAFTHRDSRAGDPDLHTHVALSNKVQAEDGRWLALDGRLLYKANVAASERYNTRIEAELTARLGLEFVEASGPVDKRPIREIAGVSLALAAWWSRRRRDVEIRRSALAAEFQDRHGRPPTAVEAISLADQAALETRDAKHAPRSEAEQRANWRHEAEAVMGGPAEVAEMLKRASGRRSRGERLTKSWIEEAAAATISAVEGSRATWQVWHLQAEAERQARAGGIARSQLDEAVASVVNTAIATSLRLGAPDPITEPAALTRSNGESVYAIHGETRYTSPGVMAAEQQLLAAAHLTGYRALSDVRGEIAVAGAGADGFDLNDAQAAMVRDLATSGAAVQLALAPAGTGKTTTMSVLAQAWAASGGQVIGLAPSAQAAHELGNAIGGHTDTLAKLTWTLANAPAEQWPAWVTGIGPTTMVILDEAGQASTTELAAAVSYITGRGGVVRLVGDDQQLASVGAGGVLRDIQHELGASTLSEVRRFRDPAEAAATLAVREGDAGAVGFYADNTRIHVGDIGAVTDQAYDAWATDRHAGLDTILLAPTRDLVTRLNTRARADRIQSIPAADRGQEVRLADGNRASAGDVIVTRRNERRITVSNSNWVKNGDRWSITAVNPDRSLVARHLELGRTVTLPASYVAEHVRLGYATTVHGAQGMTTDTAHVVATGEESRQTLYVGLSRGRDANHVYLANAHDGDPHSLIGPEALRPPTAIDVLTNVLERDGSQRSATTTRREADAPAVQFHEAVMRYHDALGFAAEQTLSPDILRSTDAELEAIWPGLTSEPAYPNLRGHLALIALDGTDPVAAVLDAAGSQELATSEDRAAVLDWRIDDSSTEGPLPWLDGIPRGLSDHTTWGPYLEARSTRVACLAAIVRDRACAWTPSGTPTWAAALTAAEHTDLRGDLAVWRAAMAVPDDDSRATGPRQSGTTAAGHQRELKRRLSASTVGGGADLTVLDLLPDDVRRDPQFERLAERIADLEAAGVDVVALLDQALSQPHPLPDERSADALWWRIVRHLGPAALRATTDSAANLRPAWSAHLTERLGNETATRVMVDGMWPALVAALHARPTEWTAEQLIDAALAGDRSEVAPEALCAALVWRVATMIDEPPEDGLEPPEGVYTPALAEERATELLSPTAPSPESATSVDRIIALNQMALDHFTQMYPRSWAPDYLRERLSTDLSDEPRFAVGYAPPGPTSLIQHLTAIGASPEELVEAGLARRTDRGRLVDAFRDRLVFPIYSGLQLVGFIGRRNPTKNDAEYAGPKYLNTRTTAAFTKGEQLFGLAEGTRELEAGARPVLVEGPFDAIAVTIAAGRSAVGIAPLGTAFTESQAAQFKPYFAADHSRIVVATDPDSAGWLSAQRAFWRLAALGADPRHLAMPDGVDPADLLRTEGPTSLADRLGNTDILGASILDRMLDDHATGLSDAAARIWLARDTARVISALPPGRWIDQIERVNESLTLPPGMLHMEVIDASNQWAENPERFALRELATLRRRTEAAVSATHSNAPRLLVKAGQRSPDGIPPTPPRAESRAVRR
ncbi:MobF family relaxase [Nocardioides marmoriginsengisoli]|nr:MobF family relaxase [Nocardioides marmoriginsengisoli]